MHSRKCLWKHRLRNHSHFVPGRLVNPGALIVGRYIVSRILVKKVHIMAAYKPMRICHHQVHGNSHEESFDQVLKITVPGFNITELGWLITIAGSVNEKTNRRKPKYRPCGFVINRSFLTGYSTHTLPFVKRVSQVPIFTTFWSA